METKLFNNVQSRNDLFQNSIRIKEVLGVHGCEISITTNCVIQIRTEIHNSSSLYTSFI